MANAVPAKAKLLIINNNRITEIEGKRIKILLHRIFTQKNELLKAHFF
jgi:hypothetical protein